MKKTEFQKSEQDKKCDLCAEIGAISPAKYETKKFPEEFAGTLLQPPRRIYFCAACYAQMEN